MCRIQPTIELPAHAEPADLSPPEPDVDPDRLPYDPELGSIVYNPLECAAGVLQKALEAEADHLKTKAPPSTQPEPC